MTLTQLTDLWRLSTRIPGGRFQIFAGVTTYEEKRDRTRSLILALGCSDKFVGTRHGQQWSFARAFHYIFGEEL